MRPLGRIVRLFTFIAMLVVTNAARSEPVLGDGNQDFDRDLADVARLFNCHALALVPDHPECDSFKFSPSGEFDAMGFVLFSCGFEGPGESVLVLCHCCFDGFDGILVAGRSAVPGKEV